MERRLEIHTERGVYGLVFRDEEEYASFFEGEVENKTGTIEAPYKLLEDPSLLRALWYLLTGCLLYTSPSPRDLSTSRMPSSA